MVPLGGGIIDTKIALQIPIPLMIQGAGGYYPLLDPRDWVLPTGDHRRSNPLEDPETSRCLTTSGRSWKLGPSSSVMSVEVFLVLMAGEGAQSLSLRRNISHSQRKMPASSLHSTGNNHSPSFTIIHHSMMALSLLIIIQCMHQQNDHPHHVSSFSPW